MMWLDFFAQVFVHALAWCLAIVTTVAVVVVAGKVWAAIGDALDTRRRQRAAWDRRGFP